MALVGVVLKNIKLEKRVNSIKIDGIGKPIISNSDVLKLLTICPITPIQTELGKYIPLDMDVSSFDNSRTKKEEVSRTYKGYDGFAPNFAYVGAEGNMINSQLRPGK